MTGSIGINLVLLLAGMTLLIFNKRLSFYYYQNRPKLEDYVQILNVRQRILILGVVSTFLGVAGFMELF